MQTSAPQHPRCYSSDVSAQVLFPGDAESLMGAPQPVKLPNELLDRADALVDYVQSLPEIAAVAGSRVTRAHVIRLALARGLADLERERAALGKPGS